MEGMFHDEPDHADEFVGVGFDVFVSKMQDAIKMNDHRTAKFLAARAKVEHPDWTMMYFLHCC